MIEQVGVFEKVPKEELVRRIDGLKRSMAGNHIDFGLVVQRVDMYYFTGTAQKGMLAVPVDGEPLLFIEKSIDRARQESPLEPVPIKNERDIHKVLLHKGLLAGVAGLELDVLPVALFDRLKRVVGFDRSADLSPSIRELRAVKSPFELTQIRKSGAMMAPVFAEAKAVVRKGAREIDIEAALVATGRMLGHQGFLRMRGMNQEMTTMTVQSGFSGAIVTGADIPVAGTGVTPAVPQGSSMKRVERGVPVTIDYGGGYNGYVTDETRAFVVGELGAPFRRPYECAREIIEDVMGYAKEGVECTEVFGRARRMAEKAGLIDYFMGYGDGQVSFIGHGLGLEINELPVITARHKMVLREGMVFAFEPKFVLPGQGAIGIEIDLVVRRQHVERVTTDSYEIVRLER